MLERMKNWLKWKSARPWGKLNRHERTRELSAMNVYYAANPPVAIPLKMKYTCH